MANKKWSWEEVAKTIEESGEALLHDRVGILRDSADETYGDSGIVRPIQYTGDVLMGTVVAVGDGDVVQNSDFCVGSHVQYNKYNEVIFQFDIEGGAEFEVIVLHIKDIYWVNNKVNDV